jgi:DNA-binding NtrC family response regulator
VLDVPAGCLDPEAPELQSGDFDLARHLERIEAAAIRDTLREHGGYVSAAARALSMSRQGLHGKISRYGIVPD